ncbi:hypothetical protein HK105_201942 [Polyrhizophydium stewartii]|uniref:Protein kinase domain-containing protein n=1 Tax=Polyrhizophydium stewartii TaxID=2732419 RepID=A0ABR4NGG3_9FUNG
MLGTQGYRGRAPAGSGSLLSVGSAATYAASMFDHVPATALPSAPVEPEPVIGEFDPSRMLASILEAVPSIRVNHTAATALSSTLVDVAAPLPAKHPLLTLSRPEHASHRALLAEVEHLFVSAAKAGLLLQVLRADSTAKRIRLLEAEIRRNVPFMQFLHIEIEAGLISDALEKDAAQLPALVEDLMGSADDKFDVQSHRIETLLAIQQYQATLLKIVPESLKDRLGSMLAATAESIIASEGRGISPPQPWTIDPDDVSVSDERIGQETSAQVFAGKWLGRDVAITPVSGDRLSTAVDAVEREAAIWFPLKHANIMPLHGSCANTAHPFLVTPRMRGDVLSALAGRGDATMRVRADVLRGVAAGMQYLHEQRQPIVHGDLRARNVLIGLGGSVRIASFAFAVVKTGPDADTPRRTSVVRFVAPEIYKRKYKLDLPSDVFAFGMTAFEILTGEAPFVELQTDKAVVDAIRQGKRPARPGGVPDAVWQVLEACWRDDPLERPTFAEIMRHLGEPAPTQTPGELQDSVSAVAAVVQSIRERAPLVIANSAAAAAIAAHADHAVALVRQWAGDPLGFTSEDAVQIADVLGAVDTLIRSTTAKSKTRQVLSAPSTAKQIETLHGRLSDLLKCSVVAAGFEPKAVAQAIQEDNARLSGLLMSILSDPDGKLDVSTHRLETLLAIEKNQEQLLDLMRNFIIGKLAAAAESIIASEGRGISPPQPWTIDPDGVSVSDERIGQETSAQVFAGKWLGRDVAITPVSGDRLSTAVDAIEREAAIWFPLKHANIMPLHGSCTNTAHPFLVTPRMRGDVLSALADRSDATMRMRADVLRGVATGMQYLHEQRQPIVHGDLRARNVLIGLGGSVRIASFAFAVVKTGPDADTPRRTSVVRFVAPEIYKRKYKLDLPSDVFAFGMTAFEILTGEAPFVELQTDKAVVDAIRQGKRPARPCGVPDAVWQVLEACWRDDPLERPTFAEIMRHLGEPAPTQTPGELQDSVSAVAAVVQSIRERAPLVIANSAAAAAIAAHADHAVALVRQWAGDPLGFTPEDAAHIADVLGAVDTLIRSTTAKSKTRQVLSAPSTAKQIETLHGRLSDLLKCSVVAAGFEPKAVAQAIQEDNARLAGLLKDIMDSSYNKFDVPSHRLETLLAIEKNQSQILSLVSETLRNRFRPHVTLTQKHITQTLGRGLRANRAWLFDPDDVCIFWDKVIGKGSQNTVYEGRWNSKSVAVKVVDCDGPEIDASAFEKQVSAWFALSHPNILPLHGACINADHPFFVTPLMISAPKASINQSLFEDHINIVLCAARGMQYLHERQPPVIHGDLKANNVLIGHDGSVRICDFGMSFVKVDLRADTQRRSSAVRWSAPEILDRQSKPDLSSDVFSFAMTALEIMTGKVPFANAMDEKAVAHAIRRGVRPARADSIPDALWDLLDDCWNKDPAERPAFAQVVRRIEALVSPNAASSPSLNAIFSTSRILGETLSRIVLRASAEQSLNLVLGSDANPQDLSAAIVEDAAQLPKLLDNAIALALQGELELPSQRLETLHAISQNQQMLLEVVAAERRDALHRLLETARRMIVARVGRSLVPSEEWSIDADEVHVLFDRKIGEGSYGEVYPAKRDGRDIAVKIIIGGHSRAAVEAIRHEAFVWRPLRHPNILRLRGVCLNTDTPFVVMPLMRTNAAEFTANNPDVKMDVRIGILFGVAQGMHYLHSRGSPVIHGDLKARSILLGNNGEVCVSDFGMAFIKSNSSINTKRRAMSTRWMAPEAQITGYKLDPSMDLFAFAMTAVEILTGRVPFADQHNDKTVGNMIKRNKRPNRPEKVPDQLWSVIEDCWHENPSARPTFAEVVALMQDLPRSLPSFDNAPPLSVAFSDGIDFVAEAQACARLAGEVPTNQMAVKAVTDLLLRVAIAATEQKAHRTDPLTTEELERLFEFVAELKRFLRRMADMHQLCRLLNFVTTAERLKQFDRRLYDLQLVRQNNALVQVGLVADASRKDAAELHEIVRSLIKNAKDKFDVPKQRLETMLSIEEHTDTLLGLLPVRYREQLGTLLEQTRLFLKKDAANGLPESNGWSISAKDVVFSTGKRFAKGSFGEVYLGRWKSERVVLKVMFDDDNHVAIDELENEVSAWFPLDHENVLKLYVMPEMREDARDFVTKHRELSVAKRIGILLDVARGMKYLHQRQPPVIHGDLKANNVLIGHDGCVRICDFGMSFVKVDQRADTQRRTGAVRWAAPEVHNQQCKLDLSSDVFSFAMTAIELLTGDVPFAEDRQADSIVEEWIKDGERPSRPQGTPDALWELIRKCWNQNPLARPTFREIVSTLESLPSEKLDLAKDAARPVINKPVVAGRADPNNVAGRRPGADGMRPSNTAEPSLVSRSQDHGFVRETADGGWGELTRLDNRSPALRVQQVHEARE